jgi:tetratricopeptide (TPR) repeat protein
MKRILLLLICCFSLQLFAQEQQLAFQYFRNGSYEKAAEMFKLLSSRHASNTIYFDYLMNCYQHLERYDEVENQIIRQLERFPNQKHLYVELGYNYQLQHQMEKATPLYEKALSFVQETPIMSYSIGRAFQNNHLLDYALKTYKKAMELNANANFNNQIAYIHGEKGEIDLMFDTYLNQVDKNEKYLSSIRNLVGNFIEEDSENENNILLKRLLIKRLQNNPDPRWNHLLSWLYIQQKEYDKALIQEIAIHKRNVDSTSVSSILDIGKITFENQDYETSKKSFHYILKSAPLLENELLAKLYLLEIDIKTEVGHKDIENQFQQIFNQYGKNGATIGFQAIYAEFLTFKRNLPKDAISVLKDALKLPLNPYQKGHLKIKLADILVFSNKFNSALIYYTQVQNDLKNHVIAQNARFKIAQTSYFKADFEWAQSQLNVLKNATSQLIANDALDLNLLITDNIAKDSLKVGLQKYANAELLAFQNKNRQAIDALHNLISQFKGQPIEDEALFKQGQLFELTNQFDKAESNYLNIIKINEEDILADDAHYYLAELYLNKLHNEEKAKEYYQKIIFSYPSSIYLVDARKKFRQLRGDQFN